MNSAGLRVKLKKVGGLFSKTDRVKWYPRTWTVRSRSNGSESLASRSNRARTKQIGRPWGFGRAGGGGTRRRRTPAAAQRRRKPNPAFPWLIRAAAGLRSMPVARVSHWGTRRGAAGFGEGRAAVGAARRNRARRRAVHRSLQGATVYGTS